MKRLLYIFLLVMLCTDGFGQLSQPIAMGEVTWTKAGGLQKPDSLPVKVKQYSIGRQYTPDNSVKSFVTKKISPQTRLVHLGRTVPVSQELRFSGKKISLPESMIASPLLMRDNADFNITYTDREHGFAGGNTTSITEDDQHRIWMGSEGRLIRYDGYHYFLYGQKTGLPDMPNLFVLCDRKQRIWLASDNGLYFLRHDSLFNLQCRDIDFSKLACTKVQIDSSTGTEKIWVSTPKSGAICISGETVSIYDSRCGLPVSNIVSVLADSRGRIFMSSGEGVVVIGQDKMLHMFSPGRTDILPLFPSLYEDEEGIWIGTFNAGLIRMNAKDTILCSVTGKFNERVYDIKRAQGGFWISVFGRFICYYNHRNLMVIDENSGLHNSYPYVMMEDSFQNIWVSDLLAGFSRINENCLYIKPYDNPAVIDIKKILPDQQQGTWYISENNNLIYKKGNSATRLFATQDKGLFQHSLDAILNEDGSLWMGSYGEGLVHVKNNVFTVYSYRTTYENQIAQSIKKDEQQRVWFSPFSFGLVQYNNGRFWHYTTRHGLLSDHVNLLFQDNRKSLYWSCDNGFQRMGQQGIENFYIGKQLFRDKINGMLSLGGSNYLLATNENGLLVVAGNFVYQYNTTNGLSSNLVNTIIRDRSGKIWISTDKGIESFNLNGIALTYHSVFNRNNGSYILKALDVFLDSTGLPFWSTRKNKLVFDPVFFQQQKKPPVFSVQRVLVDDQIQDDYSSLSVMPNQKISLEYTAICWGREQNLAINYLLISKRGDTTVRASDNKGLITISDAQPGDYRIVLMAKDNDLVYYSAPFQIRINEFWYNTWLFRILVACLVILSIVGYFRWKANLQQAINRQLEERVNEQTCEILEEKKELEKSYEVIARQNLEKDALIQEINHRVKNNLQLIAAMVEMQLGDEYSNETLVALMGTTRRIKAMSLVHELLYYKKDMQGLSTQQYITELIENLKQLSSDTAKPIQFRMAVQDIYLDPRTALSVGMIISELVSNSLKYAFNDVSSPEITIEFGKNTDTGYLQLLVADNGNGMISDNAVQKGLGSRLIDIFSRQLEGSYSIDYTNHFTFILHFKPAFT